MKTKEEIEQLKLEIYKDIQGGIGGDYGFFSAGFNIGYTQCQEDMAKKYTEEDVIRLMFNATKWDTFKEDELGYNMTLSQYFNYCLHSLNKQD